MFKDCWEKPDYKTWFKYIEKYPPLITTEHGQVLKNLIDYIKEDNSELADIGCASAEASTLSECHYTGIDLPHVIKNISKKLRSDLNYISLDVTQDNIDFIKYFNIVVMNAFIDVMKNPLEVLDKMIQYSSEYIILHRQHFTGEKTSVEKRKSYGRETYHSIINTDDFIKLLEKHDCMIIKATNLNLTDNEHWQTYLLKKI